MNAWASHSRKARIGAAAVVTVTTVADLDPEVVDMRTMLIVGASSTRAYDGVDGVRVFTARHYGGGGFAGTGALGGDH